MGKSEISRILDGERGESEVKVPVQIGEFGPPRGGP